MEISDDFKNELVNIMKKWDSLIHNLEPEFMETLKLQLDYENRLEDLQSFLKKEVDREIEKAFRLEFPDKKYTQSIKKRIYEIISKYHKQLLETIEKLE
jgi:hypothetical protein